MFLFNNSHTNQILWEKAKEYLVFKVLKENLINLFTLRHLKYLIHRTWDKHKILKRGGKNTQENCTKKDLHDPANHEAKILPIKTRGKNKKYPISEREQRENTCIKRQGLQQNGKPKAHVLLFPLFQNWLTQVTGDSSAEVAKSHKNL